MLFKRPTRGGIVAVAGDDAERVDERVGERDFKGIHDKLNIGVILLRDAVAQGRHDGEGIAEQQLFKVREAVGIAVDLAQQNIAADFDLFEDRVEGRTFAPQFSRSTNIANFAMVIILLLLHWAAYYDDD